MSQKRPQEEGKTQSGGNNNSDDKRRRIPSFSNVVQEVMRMQSVQNMFEPVLEPLIRRVVKEEVELALRKHLNSIRRNSERENNVSQSRSTQLQFLNKLALPVFTGSRIEGEESSALKVLLVDAFTGQIVTSGPESSSKVEIVVLEGDFDSDESDDWTLEEFKINIVREREGKKPLLTGDAIVILKDGIGSVGEIAFTDNSSWTRSRRFRLGARVVDGSDGTRVREAKTESFIVRDHRGELYKKHHPPSLCDEVWRLEKIGKDGAFHKRLSRESIHTVKDFLTLLFVDPPRLRNILGPGMSGKMWEVTVEHARTCVLDDKTMYLYRPSGSQQKSGVVFNVVGEILGLLSECQLMPMDKLSETEKAEAQSMVISAFEHQEEVIAFEDEAALVGGFPHLTNGGICNGTKLLAPQKMDGIEYARLDSSSPDLMSSIYNVDVSGLHDFSLHGIEDMDLTYNQSLSYPGQVISETESITHAFCDEDHLRFFETDLQNVSLESPSELQTIVNGLLLQQTTAVAVEKAQRRWTKLFSVLKWFSIRKLVALKRSRVRELPRYGKGQ